MNSVGVYKVLSLPSIIGMYHGTSHRDRLDVRSVSQIKQSSPDPQGSQSWQLCYAVTRGDYAISCNYGTTAYVLEDS